MMGTTGHTAAAKEYSKMSGDQDEFTSPFIITGRYRVVVVVVVVVVVIGR